MVETKNMSYIILDEKTMKAFRCRTKEEVITYFQQLGTPEKPTENRADFRHLIQHPNPDKLLKRLHTLIDGRGGADVGCVLMKCIQENYLLRNPTRAEFCAEFQLRGTWSAIHNYLDDNNENALARANKTVIF